MAKMAKAKIVAPKVKLSVVAPMGNKLKAQMPTVRETMTESRPPTKKVRGRKGVVAV